MVWEEMGDCHKPLTAKDIISNTMEGVLSHLHYADKNFDDFGILLTRRVGQNMLHHAPHDHTNPNLPSS